MMGCFAGIFKGKMKGKMEEIAVWGGRKGGTAEVNGRVKWKGRDR